MARAPVASAARPARPAAAPGFVVTKPARAVARGAVRLVAPGAGAGMSPRVRRVEPTGPPTGRGARSRTASKGRSAVPTMAARGGRTGRAMIVRPAARVTIGRAGPVTIGRHVGVRSAMPAGDRRGAGPRTDRRALEGATTVAAGAPIAAMTRRVRAGRSALVAPPAGAGRAHPWATPAGAKDGSAAMMRARLAGSARAPARAAHGLRVPTTDDRRVVARTAALRRIRRTPRAWSAIGATGPVTARPQVAGKAAAQPADLEAAHRVDHAAVTVRIAVRFVR